MIRSQVQ